MRRMVLALVLVLPLIPASAEAVTIRDIIELTKAGLGDNVLLALIEVDGGVFNIDTETLTRLKKAGVSEQVIVALVRSGRTRPVEEPAPLVVTDTPEPQPEFIQPPQTEDQGGRRSGTGCRTGLRARGSLPSTRRDRRPGSHHSTAHALDTIPQHAIPRRGTEAH